MCSQGKRNDVWSGTCNSKLYFVLLLRHGRNSPDCIHITFTAREAAMKATSIIRSGNIERHIYLLRGEKVILDQHLAQLYDVPTKAIVQAVKRNAQRFPSDFAFQLTRKEHTALRSQIVTSKTGRGGRRYMPFAFTEHGIAMLASVLHSKRAVDVSIMIVRTFVRLRALFAANAELAERLINLEQKAIQHDEEIRTVFEVLRQLMNPPERPRRRIGFRVEETRTKYREERKDRKGEP